MVTRRAMESDLQEAIFAWSTTQERLYPELRWLHAVPNGGKRDGREAMSLKKQGVKAGVLDIALPVSRLEAGRTWCGLKLELKRPFDDRAKPSPEQVAYMDFCTAQGYYCGWTNDFDKAKAFILAYLRLPPLMPTIASMPIIERL
ncbi:MAG: hypothetical protein ACTHKB_15735 [Burkholderiaceae bacterium]